MEYEPIKMKLAVLMKNAPFLRKTFFKLLGVVFLREWYVKRAIRNLPHQRNESLEILDAGSGFGQYTYYCARYFKNAKILGLEINPNHVEESNRFAGRLHLQSRFEEADITQISCENRFDLILNVDVLEHIEHDQLLLCKFSQALKPGGRLILSTPSLYRKKCEDGEFVGEHFREGYTEEELTGKLKEAGLTPVVITYGYGFFGDLSWRLGIRNTMALAGRGLPGKMLAPLYYLILFPLILLLMGLDVLKTNARGTGFVVTAQKKNRRSNTQQ